jgi:hypothetical protein
MAYGVHVTLKSSGDTTQVHLGPAWFIEYQDMKIARNDSLEVTGSRVTWGGRAVIIAAEVRRGEDVLMLRDALGGPVWSGWRRRSAS